MFQAFNRNSRLACVIHPRFAMLNIGKFVADLSKLFNWCLNNCFVLGAIEMHASALTKSGHPTWCHQKRQIVGRIDDALRNFLNFHLKWKSGRHWADRKFRENRQSFAIFHTLAFRSCNRSDDDGNLVDCGKRYIKAISECRHSGRSIAETSGFSPFTVHARRFSFSFA